jgi:hypothetical protein
MTLEEAKVYKASLKPEGMDEIYAEIKKSIDKNHSYTTYYNLDHLQILKLEQDGYEVVNQGKNQMDQNTMFRISGW